MGCICLPPRLGNHHGRWLGKANDSVAVYDGVTLTTNGVDFTNLPTLPEIGKFLYSPCAAAIDHSRIFMTGVGDYQADSTCIPRTLVNGRVWHHCLLGGPISAAVWWVRSGNDETSVVAAGGYGLGSDGFGDYLETVEIYSVEQNSWSTGKSLGHHLNLVINSVQVS